MWRVMRILETCSRAPRDRRDLQENVHAVLAFLNHPLDALHLPYDASEPTQRLPLRVRVHHERHLVSTIPWYRIYIRKLLLSTRSDPRKKHDPGGNATGVVTVP